MTGKLIHTKANEWWLWSESTEGRFWGRKDKWL